MASHIAEILLSATDEAHRAHVDVLIKQDNHIFQRNFGDRFSFHMNEQRLQLRDLEVQKLCS